MLSLALTIVGLAVFEIVSSLDNAVINAQVLATIRNRRVRRFFVTWGILIAVFAVRGLLPLVIVYVANTNVGIVGAFAAMFSGGEVARLAIETSAPYLMTAGGAFLALIFVHWLFVEDKEFGLPHESLCKQIGEVWFYAISSILLLGLLCLFHHRQPGSRFMLAAVIGYVAFFVTAGFKEHAEAAEARMSANNRDAVATGDLARVLFLEVIDLTFSVDGVVGAFAFTTLVPIILIGNGLGAIVVRQLTLGNIDRITRYPYLKNGAMYSIGALAAAMIIEGLGGHVPQWVSPVVTFIAIGSHLWLSVRIVPRLSEDSNVITETN